MSSVTFPANFLLESLTSKHPRRQFNSGQDDVDRWLKSFALQQQDKHLSTTKALIHLPDRAIAGFYTLATGQVDFSDLPAEISKRLPRRQLPVAVLAWLGVDKQFQRQGLGEALVAQSLHDCLNASKIFSFIAVVVDCIDEAATEFYSRWDFECLPGHARRMYLSYDRLRLMADSS